MAYPEQRYELLVEDAKYYAIILLSTDGRILSWNRGAERLTGFSSQEACGQKTSLFFTDEDNHFEVFKRELERAEKDGNSEDERWHKRKDGARFWASGIVTRVEDHAGKLLGFCKVFRENTTKKFTDDRLKAANAELTQFAYLASHDLQEPLRQITTYLQLIERKAEGKLDPAISEYMGFVMEGAGRMRALIDSLLALCRLDVEDNRFERSELNVVFDSATANLGFAVQESQAKITRCSLPSVRGDSVQLTQLFQNLIGNAIKFRGPSATPVVYLSAEKKGNEWEFSIVDNGIGIPAEDLKRIFEPLQRGHNRSEYPGTGLGLAICKRIVERHGGRIWAESTPGKGSVFRFTLPVQD
jgi:PAS domain S-box-containing protein